MVSFKRNILQIGASTMQALVCIGLCTLLAFLIAFHGVDAHASTIDCDSKTTYRTTMSGNVSSRDSRGFASDGIDSYLVPNAIGKVSEFDLNDFHQDQIFLFDASDSNSGSYVKLKDINEVSWFDRVEFPENFAYESEAFYNRLIEASDGDGVNDYLIDDAYLDLDRPLQNVSDEFYVYKRDGSAVFTGLEVGSFVVEDISDSDNALVSSLQECATVVTAAFDRDHPEVFWLDGYNATVSVTFTNKDFNGNIIGYTYKVYLVLSGFQNLSRLNTSLENVRSVTFVSEHDIKAAMLLRDQRVQELLAKVGVDYEPSEPDYPAASYAPIAAVTYTNSEKIRFFNKWLTCSNAYNSEDPDEISGYYPLAFECLSALVGRTGTVGPVCEGYARALKVMCDASGIGCVLVDGWANGNHMWNNVEIEGKWYAVDVTWDDPASKDQAVSGYENENYLLVGNDTIINGLAFGQSHSIQNSVYKGGLGFTNGPALESNALEVFNGVTYEASKLPDTDIKEYSTIDIGFLDSDMRLAQISSIPDYTYASKAIEPVPEVRIGTKILSPGTDMKLEYSNNTQSGTATLTITGMGQYKGVRVVSFHIWPTKLEVESVTIEKKLTYTGENLMPEPKIKIKDQNLKINFDYKVSLKYANNKNVGTGSVNVTITGIGSCEGSVVKNLTFKIEPAKVAVKSVSIASSVAYTGKKLTPKPIVKTKSSSLRLGKDYVVDSKYSNSKSIGKGKVVVTVRGIGNYTGSVLRTLHFKIVPKKMGINSLISQNKAIGVRWTKAPSALCTGYQIRCSTNSKFKSGVKVETIKKRASVSTSIKKLKSKKLYYVSIRAYKTVGGVKYYGNWSSTKKVKTK